MIRSFILSLVLSGLAGLSHAQCRQALALGLDVSGSVDPNEYRLQLDGLADALRQADVHTAFLGHEGTNVRLMIYEWSGLEDQRVVIPWSTITSSHQLNGIATTLTDTQQARAQDDTTAIAAAMLFGTQELQQQDDCWQKTLDISGDGPANIGAHPKAVTEDIVGSVTINGLVIAPNTRSNTTKNLTKVKTLLIYYRSFVIRGPGAFIEVAETHMDFADAMRRKLIRELQLPNLSQLTSSD